MKDWTIYVDRSFWCYYCCCDCFLLLLSFISHCWWARTTPTKLHSNNKSIQNKKIEQFMCSDLFVAADVVVVTVSCCCCWFSLIVDEQEQQQQNYTVTTIIVRKHWTIYIDLSFCGCCCCHYCVIFCYSSVILDLQPQTNKNQQQQNYTVTKRIIRTWQFM